MPQEIATLSLTAKADTKGAERALLDLEKRAKSSVQNVNREIGLMGSGGGGMGGMLNTALGVLGGNLLTSAIGKIGGAFTGAVSDGLEFIDLIQRARIAMTFFSGDAGKATEHLKELIKFGTETPFETKDVIEYSQRMQGLGFAAKDVIPILTALGNRVAALGGDPEMLERIVRAITDIKTKGRVQGEEIRQLANAGVPAWRILADAMAEVDKNFAKLAEPQRVQRLMKLSEAGRLNADWAIKALIRGMDVPHAMEAMQSTTMQQVDARLRDLWTQRAAEGLGLRGDLLAEGVFKAILEAKGKAADALASDTGK
jgi:tape measure domain-containing protein